MPGISTLITRLFALFLLTTAYGANEVAAQPPPATSGTSGNSQRTADFDVNKDGRLDVAERAAARAAIKAEIAARPPRRGRGGGGGGGRGDREPPTPVPGKKIGKDDVKQFPNADLYDMDTLRTIFLDFDSEDWESEMADFYRTDIGLPATMTVDGETYEDVSVGFRGNSSFFTLAAGQKRSISVWVNEHHRDQRLLGYRSLNLLNAHADPSFLRETLFTYAASHYIPNYRANLVRVVINGENWGIYVNSQQFNSDLTAEYFGTRKGVRWKFPPGRNQEADKVSIGELAYAGPDESSYLGAQLKTPEVTDAWANLIELCRRLKETPTEKLDTDLDDILYVDGALWFLALDNLFIDGDGYLSRASDYTIYQHPRKRFHILHYDSNETFRSAGGGGPGVSLPTAPGSGMYLDPFVLTTDDTKDLANRPLLRLLENPRLRMRYTAHVRTIMQEWIDWEKIGPVIERLMDMIDEDVKMDTRQLHSYEAFASGGGGERGAPTLKDFIDARQLYLVRHPELEKAYPQIVDVMAMLPANGATSKQKVEVTANVTSEVGIDQVILYFTGRANVPFRQVAMKKTSAGTYVGTIPTFPAGAEVRYYVEARSAPETGTTAFYPTNTERGALSYEVQITRATKTSVVINEILSSNKMSAKDPQGEFEDYVELKNTSNEDIDISGLYLSDNRLLPRKWMFPLGTVIPANGYLLVWADEDDVATEGLHANFRLSKSGETVMLIDSDDNDNKLLDQIGFENLRADVAYGRIPDGTGKFEVVHASAGAPNR